MSELPRDWAFTPGHDALVEDARLNSGAGTLVDWACTVALTTPGTLPQDAAFGAGLSDLIGSTGDEARAVGERLRGYLYDDERIGDVTVDGSTSAGAFNLPVRFETAPGPYRLCGLLTTELVEAIIEDEDFDSE